MQIVRLLVLVLALSPALLPAEPVIKANDEADVKTSRLPSTGELLIQKGTGSVHIYQLVEEMVDDLTEDLRSLNPTVVSPMAFQGLHLTPNLSASFGTFVEGTILAAVAGQTNHDIKRCVACRALHTRAEDDVWVIRMGMVRQEDMQSEAEKLGVVTFLRAALSWFPRANVVALQAEVVRALDGAVLWSEVYRSDASTAAILRTGTRIQTREERVLELERKLARRPYYGYRVWGGAARIPYDRPEGSLNGVSAGIQIFERFGEDNRWLYGITADGFMRIATDIPLLGAFALGALQYEIFPPNLNNIVIFTGPALGGFLAGTEGNSVVAEWTVDVVLNMRLGGGASIFYFRPVEFVGRDLGGVGAKLRASATW